MSSPLLEANRRFIEPPTRYSDLPTCKFKPLHFRLNVGRNDGSTTPSLVYMRKTRNNTHLKQYQQPMHFQAQSPSPRLSLSRVLLPNTVLQPLHTNTAPNESNERLEERETRPLSLETRRNEFK